MKVFLGTNVWLSATIISGLSEHIVLQCADRGWLYTSDLLRTEAHEALARKFLEVASASAMFDAAWKVAQRIEDLPTPANDADPRLVKAAEEAKMDWVITGDKRVLG